MKNLFLALLVGTASVAFANHNASVFNFRTENHSNVQIEFDGQTYLPARDHKIGNVLPGNHHLVVKKSIQTHCGFQTSIIFNGYITVQPRVELHTRLTHHRGLVMNSYPLYSQNNNSNYSYGNNNGGYNQTTVTSCTNFSSNYNNGNGYSNNNNGNNWNGNNNGGTTVSYNYGNNYNNVAPINNSFVQLKQTIMNSSFDDTKLKIAKQAIGSNQMQTLQILEIMNLMTFESNKLELAKYAYVHVVDPNNYYMINNGFTFSSSVSNLDDYIAVY